jgi:hypothetical protein
MKLLLVIRVLNRSNLFLVVDVFDEKQGEIEQNVGEYRKSWYFPALDQFDQ